ncbi:unnamed protein product [Protopolystoma xenopodis]|uniref:Uncharacterized protein n=1 Tax=Protopolystoma xenopodis TaxID=117903 RepID=A0A3S5A002_9PLAT|nr:unnamed protein product [Protopolystoma xenopodis]
MLNLVARASIFQEMCSYEPKKRRFLRTILSQSDSNTNDGSASESTGAEAANFETFLLEAVGVALSRMARHVKSCCDALSADKNVSK